MSDTRKLKYLIIGGASKAGTTSAFEYLKDHPAVCGSYVKQTFYFLDAALRDSGLISIYDFEKDPRAYQQFFRDCGDKNVRLEASPDYLYSPGTARRIGDYLGEGSDYYLIFLLRNPVSRVVSWFTYGKQQGKVPAEMDFKTFVEKNRPDVPYTFTDMPFTAVYTGMYSRYLKPFFDVLGAARIRVYFYEDLIRDPKSFIEKLCRDTEIDPSFYETYAFGRYNESLDIKNARLAGGYARLRRWVMQTLYKNQLLYTLTGPFKRMISKAYKSMNTKPLEKPEIDPAALRSLEQVFTEDIQKLEKLLGQKTPWVS